MTTGNRFRATRIDSIDIGLTYGRKWEFYDPDGEPHDLTQYSGGISVIVFDANDVKVDLFACTVLTADADKTADSDGTLVANKMTFLMAPTGSAGNYFAHVVGLISATPYQLGQPVKIRYNSAPPTS